jgi:ribosomal protein S18 acetylase RimI-like enzyme
MRKNQVIYRHATMDDIEALIKLELKVWGKDMAADRDKWISRISIFPEGVHIAEKDDNLIGVIVNHVINWIYPSGYFPSWVEATDDGYITNHDDNGNVLYGVDVSVKAKREGIASELMNLAIDIMREKSITRGMLGSRIPSLSSHVKEHNIRELNPEQIMFIAKEDLSVKFFQNFNFKIIGIRKGYFPEDKESLGRAAILELILK